MNTSKHMLSTIFLLLSLNLAAQNITTDSITREKVPVQAFALMPVLFGIHLENAFPHDRTYKSISENELTLPFNNGQNYSIFGSIPIVKKRKGFSLKGKFTYDIYKENIGHVSLNNKIIVDEIEETATSAYAALKVSQEIPLKKWKTKLLLSGTFSASGQNYTRLRSYKTLVNAKLPLKMTANSMFMVGVIGIIGENVRLPVIPLVVYFTRLTEHMNLELVLPISAKVRYVVSNKNSLSLGAKIGSRTPYVGMDLPILQSSEDALEFKSQNLRLHFNAEKAVSKWIWFNAEVGYNHNRKAILNTANVDLYNKIFTGTDFGYPYARIGLFLRPVFGVKR